ncbi:transcription antitermination factor NusB [Salidesulfovibrio onnuriiensis]|uniref:transcription antitermination factor NusB n=1 Tax=Salidesulfovibrio onnuriiensis TaxID=2583823 RepID=UPI0011C79E24|nr:transcription antitermination factor NusB [Salidesulfovibrio onnuriiensis]
MPAPKNNTPKRLPPAREAALEALHRCLGADTDIQGALDRALSSRRNMDPRDAALATELCYGYLRLKGRLEYILSRYLKDPSQLPPKMRLAMGVAAYELLYLERIPAYSTVNWAVDFAKTKPNARLTGLFNAVLRRVSELGDEVHDMEWYAEGATEIETLCRYYSCPEWIIQLWTNGYGQDIARHYLEAQVRPPAIGLNLYRHPDADILYNELAANPGIIDIDGMSFALQPGTPLPKADPPMDRQSFAARQVVEMLGPKQWPTPIWDACAGRGGKSRVLKEMGIDDIFASDVHLGRLNALHRELPKIPVFAARADQEPPIKGAGSILLDLPCSGLGVLSRRPDTKWRRTPHNVAELEQLQARILDKAVSVLKPGGTIAIITCTLNPDENERQLDRLLKRHAHAQVGDTFTTSPDSHLNEFFWGAVVKV